jgi:branched-chain amino acid transport system substrate-binding protein
MVRRRTLASLLVVGALSLGGLGAGCTDDDSGDVQVGELSVGVLAPLTGDLSAVGRSGARAADLAAVRVNRAAVGVGLHVTLAKRDSRTDPQAAQEGARELIEDEGVTAIVGPWATSELVPTAENLTVAAGVPVISPWSTWPGVTYLDDDGLVFRTAPSDALQGRALATLVARAVGPRARVVTVSRDDPDSSAPVHELTDVLRRDGGTVMRELSLPSDGTVPKGDAARIVAGEPDAWVIGDEPDSWGTLGRRLLDTGRWRAGRTFTTDALRDPGLPAALGPAVTDGIRGTVPTLPSTPTAEAFRALWTARGRGPLHPSDAQAFDAVVLVALAASSARSGDPSAIAERLPAVSGPPGKRYTFRHLDAAFRAAAAGRDIDYEGVSGPIDLDAAGDPSAASYATWTYRDGALAGGTRVIDVRR